MLFLGTRLESCAIVSLIKVTAPERSAIETFELVVDDLASIYHSNPWLNPSYCKFLYGIVSTRDYQKYETISMLLCPPRPVRQQYYPHEES